MMTHTFKKLTTDVQTLQVQRDLLSRTTGGSSTFKLKVVYLLRDCIDPHLTHRTAFTDLDCSMFFIVFFLLTF